MDEEPPSKIQTCSAQCSSTITNNTVDQRVIPQGIIDIVCGVIFNIFDKVIEQSRVNQEKGEAEQAKINETSRLSFFVILSGNRPSKKEFLLH